MSPQDEAQLRELVREDAAARRSVVAGNWRISVLQDGRDFYYATGGGELLWTAPEGTVRGDWDTDGAHRAREMFEEWVWEQAPELEEIHWVE